MLSWFDSVRAALRLPRRNRCTCGEVETRCREVLPHLQRYIDGELDAASAAELERHLDACLECGLELEVYRDIKKGLAERRRDPDHAAWFRLREFAMNLGRGR